ncbi:OprD family outer membrane porin [Azoarcus sp. KH32C]|uniref:OprD family outer membrane porin n=1 Tax=Azoarcus sp. KH32C TaxID=748247 RepID=UPI0002385C2B|nr:OprD family outer membrane porin [Azoarcus sp. KH32C]BAL27390.1 hypothetical protein AZKH_p0507 [Azoarcus sp. KH32C]
MTKKNLAFDPTQACVGALAGLIGAVLPAIALAAEGQHELELKVHGVYWADEGMAYPRGAGPNPKTLSYQQSALGGELNYKSPYWSGLIGFDASVYGVLRISNSGTPTSQLTELGNNGQLSDGYMTLGQAFVKLKWDQLALVKVGRQLHDSLLLKSTYNRAVPDTYSGVNAVLTPVEGLRIQGAVYDQWRARTTNDFEKFRTEAVGKNAIDYVAVLGASYVNGPYALTAEYLNSKPYLSKYGFVGAYTAKVRDTLLKLSGGAFWSRDAGSLFVCGAEREMDCTGHSRIGNDGFGAYLDADWKISNLTIGAAVAKFNGFWIEDNFAVDANRKGALTQDPGTNPFPTSSTVGPDFTNKGERVGSIRLAYDWKDYVAGLKTAFKYIHGTGARSSNLHNSAEGSESYREFDVRYELPIAKGLSVRYVYLNYDSRIDNRTAAATIKGLTRQDWEQHRVYVDYVYQF